MNRLWICLFLIATAFGASKAQSDENGSPDNFEQYDDQWYADELENLGILDEPREESSESREQNQENNQEDVPNASIETAENNFDYDNVANEPDLTNVGDQEKNENEIDIKVEKEIKDFRGEIDAHPVDYLDDDTFDIANDYQYEDNRSEVKEEQETFEEVEDNYVKDEQLDPSESIDSELEKPIENHNRVDDAVPKAESVENDAEKIGHPFKDTDNNYVSNEILDTVNDEKDVNNNDNKDPLPSIDDEMNKEIFDETKKILNEDSNNNDFTAEKPMEIDEQPNIDEVIKETNKLLDETDENLNEGDDDSVDNLKQDNAKDKQPNIDINNDEDTVDKVYEDLNADLNKLFETWDKLTSDDVEEKHEDNVDDEINPDYIAEYEDKYQRPFREKLVLEQRDDYENIDDGHLSEIFVDDKKPVQNPIADDFKMLSVKENDDIVSEDNEFDEEEIVKESNMDDILQKVKDENSDPVPYINDALVANEDEKQKLEDLAETPVDKKSNKDEDPLNNIQAEKSDVFVNDQLIKQLEGCPDNSPIHTVLEIGEAVTFTSCNYPKPYPTNSIVEWVFEGKGVGIEFNISDFTVDSASGDYLLVIPGAVNDNSSDGLIFSYRLNEERRYRFLNVDRMFVRFHSEAEATPMRGFKFNVKMLSERPEEPEMLEPELEIPNPRETFTVHLGGTTCALFNHMKEQFRQMIADMANLYINVNQIDPGLMNTSMVTQIVNTTICNRHWPNYENCIQVKFGVPLAYEEYEEDEEDGKLRLNQEDLRRMWNTYIHQEPFATQLQLLGLEEFPLPNDTGVMIAWLVISLGVIISMAMLGFALWRFSCFEDYTRMPAYTDTDSVHNEKQVLDLYPTPHQTLPPLFYESEYKWPEEQGSGVRVDMGGFTNKSYEQSDLYNIESDEEVMPTRDRYNNVTPEEA